jgi:hypothetical protein
MRLGAWTAWFRLFGIALVILGFAPALSLASPTPRPCLLGARGQTAGKDGRAFWAQSTDMSAAAFVSRNLPQLGAKGQTDRDWERILRKHRNARGWGATAIVLRRTSTSLRISRAGGREKRPGVDHLHADPFTCPFYAGTASSHKPLHRRLARSATGFVIAPALLTSCGGLSSVSISESADRSFTSTFTPHVSFASLLQRWSC